jgi:hypothetical protein
LLGMKYAPSSAADINSNNFYFYYFRLIEANIIYFRFKSITIEMKN